ncbi:MAG: type II toxin-antitoxin system VapC family toxin [Acidobacteriota bacterium]|nr:type II toxin-antitoxin system VapC family toxin [Acidobacteriota bacterium]
MSSFVLDSSAVLALIDEETGSNVVQAVLHDSAIGTVNLAEVYTKVDERGKDGRSAVAAFLRAVAAVEPFTQEHAAITGWLRQQTRNFGLSLGDRACIALAITMGAEIYTADSIWLQLDLGCRIHLIR